MQQRHSFDDAASGGRNRGGGGGGGRREGGGRATITISVSGDQGQGGGGGGGQPQQQQQYQQQQQRPIPPPPPSRESQHSQQQQHQQQQQQQQLATAAIVPTHTTATAGAVIRAVPSADAGSVSSHQSSQQLSVVHSQHSRSHSQQSQRLQQYQQLAVQPAMSVESPLPPAVQRCLGDRSYDKRKNAALEIESLVKGLHEAAQAQAAANAAADGGSAAAASAGGTAATTSPMIHSVVAVLSRDFATSMNANYRKGGLIGIAATAIGLGASTSDYLDVLLPPVLHCFDDPESRVRYYACESLYNIAKVARTAVLGHFNPIFEGLCKLFADVDVDVKNGATLLDRLIKDIVTESDRFDVDAFVPLLQNYIRRTNPYIRQLLVGWITVLDGVPDVNMIDWLPDFLDGLFNMLSDSNREIRQAADSALSEFLREVKESTVVEFGPMVAILVLQCHSKERLNRLIAITWIAEFIHLGGDALLPFHSDVLGAVMRIISDEEVEIRRVAERTNDDLLLVVRDTTKNFELSPLLGELTRELASADVATKMAALRWINMLLEKKPREMNAFITDLLPVLLRTLRDASDPVVLLNLQVLGRISLHERAEFGQVLNAVLRLFSTDRHLLETRGSLIVRKLCVLLNAKSVYIKMADVLVSNCQRVGGGGNGGGGGNEDGGGCFSLEFVGTMVQTLNLILLTAAELHELRALLKDSLGPPSSSSSSLSPLSSSPGAAGAGNKSATTGRLHQAENRAVFVSLFHCWCHNPVATFSLCLLAQAYEVSYALVGRLADLGTNDGHVTVGFLVQVDKLVQLLESPAFVHLRLQLLDVDSPRHAPLLKACYGLLMMLPQSDAFRTWNDRLATVCNLRDNLGLMPAAEHDGDRRRGGAAEGDDDEEDDDDFDGGPRRTAGGTTLDSAKLLARFDAVMEMHREARDRRAGGGGGGASSRESPLVIPIAPTTTTQQQQQQQQQQHHSSGPNPNGMGGGGGGGVGGGGGGGHQHHHHPSHQHHPSASSAKYGRHVGGGSRVGSSSSTSGPSPAAAAMVQGVGGDVGGARGGASSAVPSQQQSTPAIISRSGRPAGSDEMMPSSRGGSFGAGADEIRAAREGRT